MQSFLAPVSRRYIMHWLTDNIPLFIGFYRELRGAGERISFALPLINSSFQSNLTQSKLGENKIKPQTCLPHLPTLWEFIVEFWEGPEKRNESPSQASKIWDTSHSVERKEPSMPNYLWQLSTLTFKRSSAQKWALTTHYHENCGEKKAKFCLGVWKQTSRSWLSVISRS